jgi:uncharacterized damage-inducible protein DinB
MPMTEQPEVWLRGPIAGIHPALMPVAHTLLQTCEDAERAVEGLSSDELWESVGGTATLGFHLRHLAGSTDRLFTLAEGERLNEAQRATYAAEKGATGPFPDAATLLNELRRTVDDCIGRLRRTSADALHVERPFGRSPARPTTLGLLFHAAEHSQRHAGQMVTTARIIRARRA